MKKLVTTIGIGFTLFSGFTFASNDITDKEFSVESVVATKSENIQRIYKETPDYFVTSKRTDADLELEQTLISAFKEKYVDKKEQFEKQEYNDIMNNYFVDALKTSNSKLADYILYESGADIDVNRKKSKKPKITPLMATATAIETDGGDIEYFIKLIEMGANPSEVTENYDIPLMSLASAVDNYKIVLYLAMLGENIMYVDGYDYYPLDYAQKNDSYKTVIILSKLINEYQKSVVNKIEKSH